MTREREEARNTYEVRIHELELLVKRQEHSIAELRSTLLELRTILTQKKDVEDQLYAERARNE